MKNKLQVSSRFFHSINKTLFVIVLLAFLVRVINLQFPAFTADEARVAYRGYVLVETGKDELGRRLPWLFNSSEDYQLPMVSYLTALGIFAFGKSDLGARIPFILIGTTIVFLVYRVGERITKRTSLSLVASLTTALSPSLIFLSKVPNETILLTLLFCLLFYFLSKKKIGKLEIVAVILIILGSVMTSKYAWFILGPFVFATLTIYQVQINYTKKRIITIFACLISLSMLLIFLNVPQATRSLEENNFNLFNDITIKNSIGWLRGQGLILGWPEALEKALFNKLEFVFVGLIHWLSNLQFSIYFGELDGNGQFGFMGLGAWAKVLIIPAGLGILFLMKRGNIEQKYLLLYLLLLTWPALFRYPHFAQELVVLTLPFMAVVIAMGFNFLNKNIAVLVIMLMFIEVFANLLSLSTHKKNTENLRPSLIKPFIHDIENSKARKLTAISDDINEDIIPFVSWYSVSDPEEGFLNIIWAYKFRQTNLKNFRTIGAENTFDKCNIHEQMTIYVSERDLNKVEVIGFKGLETSYQNVTGKSKVFLLPDGVCVR